MAKKDRFPEGYYDSEGSGSSGRIDAEIAASENSSAPKRKWSTLNPSLHNGFGVPIRVLPLSTMSLHERDELVLGLRAELEQIRVAQKRMESQRTNPITLSSSSGILSSSDDQNLLPVGNSRTSLALTGGPGKKLNPASNKARGWSRGTSGRFQSVKQPLAPCSSNSILMNQCENLLKKLILHNYGWVFDKPVDPVKLNLPDYFDVIKNPMDLGTIKKKIASCQYSTPLEFLADVRLTFTNAMKYNPAGTDVHIMADALSKFFEVRWKLIEKKLSVNVPQPLPEVSGLHVETDNVKPIPPSKKRKISGKQQKLLPQPAKRIMTADEKHKLGGELESLSGDLPDNIIEFLKEQSSKAGEDEILIDIDILSDDTLFKLQKLLDDYRNEKQNHARDEPCEIELLNESGLSNSSMQLYKGNELADEDVDIGGNELHVTSCPPVEIQKDPGHKSNKCISPRSSSDSDSSGSSDGESDIGKASNSVKLSKDDSDHGADLDGNAGVANLVDGNQAVSGLDQLDQTSQQKPNSVESDCCQDGESAPMERPVSPDKSYRAALLKIRFADTILKAREKTLNQGEKGDSERLRLEREKLELQKRKEKARLQAEAKAAEEARKRAEAEAAAESKRQRELEREAAREALLKLEKTVEIDETSRFLKDLEMLRTTVHPEQLPPNSGDETSPDHPSLDGLGSFKFGGGSNPLEQLGLFMKMDEDDEEVEPPSTTPNIVDEDVEEGEID